MPKSILITGAASGIGRDTAFALAALGHRVYATTANDAQADALRAECLERRLPMTVFRLDITDADDRALAAPLVLDVLINNAGVGESGSLAEVPMERIRRTFEVNVFSTLELTQLVLRGMIERRLGAVLFVSSIAGRLPVPFLMPYSMSKFALSAAGAGLRAEMDQLGAGIQIALIEPGAFHTGFNQAMTASKYQWMAHGSYFSGQVARMQAAEARQFRLLEATNTGSIVQLIVKAALAPRPRLRYTAPWLQGLAVRLARVFGV
ncbi:MAG TPA: SDR family NAD(P)-dependent oxidoreductase [Burkholderiaceae bacterium]|nr:SDR family NAD(P)-dependent oxidoreductase [Burkholderiaceae bacterium]